jgi:hypothetical protein
MPGDTILLNRNLASGIEWGRIYPASARSSESVFTEVQNSNFDPFSIIANFAIALGIKHQIYSESFLMMAATEPILMEDWNMPEEDEAWADLLKEK